MSGNLGCDRLLLAGDMSDNHNRLSRKGFAMKRKLFRSLIVLVFALSFSAAHAQAGGQIEHHESSSDEPSDEHTGGHGHHKNFITAFAGITHAGRRENGLALGLGYDRMLTDKFSIGVIAEHTFGDADFTVYAVPLAYRVDRWKFVLAGGVEDGEHGTESLLRLATEYAYKVGNLEISPQVALDFVDNETVWVFGVVFGRGF